MNKLATKNVLCDLPNVGVIQVSGADAETFLQAQLTNDITTLDAQHWQKSAYCNPKGRVIALMDIVRRADGFWVMTHADLLSPLIQRLTMYVLRAKVGLEVLTNLVSIGISGNGNAAIFQNRWPDLGNSDKDAIWQDGILVQRIEGRQSRFKLTGLQKKIDTLLAQLETEFIPGSSDNWKKQDIFEGVPMVNSITTEQFIPQALNLDLIEGVSFNKGCYPGQEIVARIHFLGKSKQRMRLAHIADGASVMPGDLVYRDGQEQRVGTVVDAVCDESGCHALLSTAVDLDGTYRLQKSRGASVEWHELPYDITA